MDLCKAKARLKAHDWVRALYFAGGGYFGDRQPARWRRGEQPVPRPILVAALKLAEVETAWELRRELEAAS